MIFTSELSCSVMKNLCQFIAQPSATWRH